MLNKMDKIENQPLVVSFISGKGSIGKSTILSLLAKVLSKEYASILIWDNDIYSPIQHILNGVEPNISLLEVVTNNIAAHKAITKVSNRIFLVGGANRFDIDIDMSEALVHKFMELLKENDFDIVLVDCHSGFSKIILNFSKISSVSLLFLSDEPTSILDAYGLTKILYKFFGIKKIATVVNNVVDNEDGLSIAKVFNQATTNFLGTEFSNFGIIPYEKDLKKYIFNLEDFVKNKASNEFLESCRKLAGKINTLKFDANIFV